MIHTEYILRIHNIYKRSIIIKLSTISNSISEHNTHSIYNYNNKFKVKTSRAWKKRACRGPATITRLPRQFINQFFHHIKLLQPYDVCRHQPVPFYDPDCYICEHCRSYSCYQRCARESVVIACVSEKHTEPPISQGQRYLECR